MLSAHKQPNLRVILPDHVAQRVEQRGRDLDDVESRVRRAHELVKECSFLLGLPLALQGGDVLPIVEFRQHETRATVATVLLTTQALKPGTVPVEV